MSNRIPVLINEYNNIVLPNIEASTESIINAVLDYETALVDTEVSQENNNSESIKTDSTLQMCDKAIKQLLDLKETTLMELIELKSLQLKLVNSTIPLENCSTQFERDLSKRKSEFNFSDIAKQQNEQYKLFRSDLFQIRNPGKAFKFEGTEIEDDVEFVSGTLQTKCPITQSIMNEVYTAKCDHCFSDAIFQLIRDAGNTVNCPVPGCRERISTSDLKKNNRMAKAISRWIKRQKETEDANVYEEVIE